MWEMSESPAAYGALMYFSSQSIQPPPSATGLPPAAPISTSRAMPDPGGFDNHQGVSGIGRTQPNPGLQLNHAPIPRPSGPNTAFVTPPTHRRRGMPPPPVAQRHTLPFAGSAPMNPWFPLNRALVFDAPERNTQFATPPTRRVNVLTARNGPRRALPFADSHPVNQWPPF